MNENANPTRTGSRFRRSKLVWLLLVPLLFFLAVVAYLGIPEWNAAQANRNQFKQWAAAGIPYDNVSLQKDYEERTYPEGAADWIESTKLVDWGREVKVYEQLPYLGRESEEPVNLVPGGGASDWPGEPLVADFLMEMEPVINLIERASSHSTPVRFPVKFDGIGTLHPYHQESRSIQRLLSLDCDFAYFHKDHQRVMRDLSLMEATAEAYDGRDCLISGLVNGALRSIRMSAVRRTLTHCQWSASELDTLRDSLALKEEISARWQDIMLRERAFGLAIVDEPPENLAQAIGQEEQFSRQLKLYTGPSEVTTLIEAYQKIIELPKGADISKWKQRGDALDDWIATLPSNSLAAMLVPAGYSCLEAEVRVEEIRRWTLTAIAIQQFKLQNERWPKELAELESVGLNFDDYSNTHGKVFGYKIVEDKVYLWKNEGVALADGQISKTVPVPDEENKDISGFVLQMN